MLEVLIYLCIFATSLVVLLGTWAFTFSKLEERKSCYKHRRTDRPSNKFYNKLQEYRNVLS